jgi:integrase
VNLAALPTTQVNRYERSCGRPGQRKVAVNTRDDREFLCEQDAQGVHPRVVMETLGRSGIAITMDVYGHVMPQQQREAADALASVLRW